MGPTWVLSAPDGPHVGPMNLAIRVCHDVAIISSGGNKSYTESLLKFISIGFKSTGGAGSALMIDMVNGLFLFLLTHMARTTRAHNIPNTTRAIPMKKSAFPAPALSKGWWLYCRYVHTVRKIPQAITEVMDTNMDTENVSQRDDLEPQEKQRCPEYAGSGSSSLE